MTSKIEATKEEYNGWTNWETWNVNLWLTNDESVNTQTRELLQQEYEYKFQREEALRDWVYELIHEHEYIKDDISLHRVNYKEIINSFLADMKEELEFYEEVKNKESNE